MILKNFLLFLCIILWISSGFSYSAMIKGKVINLESGKPVEGARVSARNAISVSFTDEKGMFTLKKLDMKGEQVTLRVEAHGYISTTQSVELKTPDSHITIKLPEDRLLKYNIIVTATKTNHTVGDVPVESKVVTIEEIQQKNLTNIQDVFAYLSGIQVSRGDNSWVRGSVRIQGMDDSHTLVLVNGQEYKGGIGGLDISTLPINSIKRIEVVKGPSSVLYGSDAIGGVINIITKSPLQSQSYFNLRAGYGSNNKQNFELNGNYNHGKLGFSMNLNHKHQDGIDKIEDENITDTIVGGEIAYQINNYNQITIISRYEHSKQEKADQWQNRYSVAGNWEWNNNRGSLVKIRTSWLRDNYENTEEGKLWDRDFIELESTGSHILFKNNLFTGGYRLRYERQDDPSKNFQDDQFIHSLYLQDEISIKSLTIVLGSRVDFHKQWGSQLTPKINIMFSPFSNWTLRGSVGKAFKAPTLQRLYAPDWIMGSRTLVVSNPDLKPEESIGYQLGLEWDPSKNFNLKGSFFLNNLDNQIVSRVDRSTTPQVMSYYNIEEVRAKGVEISLQKYLGSGFKMIASYTYVKTENLTENEPILNTPDHNAIFGLHWTSRNKRLEAVLDGRYVGERFDEVRISGMNYETITLDPYFTLDLSVTARVVKGLKVFLRLDNLTGLNDIYDEYWIDGIKIFSGLSYRFD